MEPSTLLGSAGVAMLLGAFALNLFGVLPARSRIYHTANAVGAGLAALASAMIEYVPFVVLEGIWCLVALVALVSTSRSTPGGTHAGPRSHPPTALQP